MVFQGSSLFARCVFMRAKSWVVWRAPGWMKAVAVDRVMRRDMRVCILARNTQIECLIEQLNTEHLNPFIYIVRLQSDRHPIYI